MNDFMKTILSAVKTWTKGRIKDSTADWNENDSSKDSYVKGRTHWDSRVTTKHSITFDGNLDGKEAILVNVDENLYYVKVSDDAIKSSKLVGGTASIFLEGQIITEPLTTDAIRSEGNMDMIGEGIVIVYEDTAISDLDPIFTTGVWFVCVAVDGVLPFYVSSVKWSETTGELKKLDSKYLDNIVTTDDMQEVMNIANNAQTTADSKMDTNNPVGTGSFSMNRKAYTTVGDCSHAEGYGTTASGDYSHAEGYDTVASGNYSHAEGYGTTASNPSAHAEGNDTLASGMHSHAEGTKTVAQRLSQHVQGRFNILDTEGPTSSALGKYAHIVGNGTSDDALSNAHTLDWKGNAWYAGNVYVNSTSGTNMDEGSVRLARVDEIPSINELAAAIQENNSALSSYILSVYPSSTESDIFIFEINNNGVKQTYPMKLIQSTKKTEDGSQVAINQIAQQYRFEFQDESVTNTILQNILNEFINADYSKFIFSYGVLESCVSTSISFSGDTHFYPGLYVNGGHILIRLHPLVPSVDEPV